ncbi:MAG: DUF721 domain-containing protein [Chlorobi bacterium]|nr:DUF721 domain-containing protein [Chlorobiota bacterium]
MKPLSHFLQTLLTQHGLAEKLQQAQIPELFRQHVGTTVMRRVESVTFHNGELLVKASSALWRIELRMRAENIRRALNQQLGKETIRIVTIL